MPLFVVLPLGAIVKRVALVGEDRPVVGQGEAEAAVVDPELAGALDRVIGAVGQGIGAGAEDAVVFGLSDNAPARRCRSG